jgi:hypothetical protein
MLQPRHTLPRAAKRYAARPGPAARRIQWLPDALTSATDRNITLGPIAFLRPQPANLLS